MIKGVLKIEIRFGPRELTDQELLEKSEGITKIIIEASRKLGKNMITRAKFHVLEVINHEPQFKERVLKLGAVADTKESNKSWAKYTPNGSLELHITNVNLFESIDQLKRGDEYWLDLSPTNE